MKIKGVIEDLKIQKKVKKKKRKKRRRKKKQSHKNYLKKDIYEVCFKK